MYAEDHLAKAEKWTQKAEGIASPPDQLALLHALLAIAQRLDTLAARPS
jgi:hypothetical protein